MCESMFRVSRVLLTTVAFALSVNLVACSDSDSALNVQSGDSDSALDWLSNGSVEVAASSESSNIESSSSDLMLSCSGRWFGGSFAQDSPEGTSLGLESASIIASCPKKRLYSSFAILNAKTPWPWKRNLLQMVSKWLRTWASPSKATKNFLISLRDLYVRMKLQITFRLGVEKQFSRNLSRTTI